MCIFLVFLPAFALACLAEHIIDRPRKAKVYRKARRRSFGYAPGRLWL